MQSKLCAPFIDRSHAASICASLRGCWILLWRLALRPDSRSAAHHNCGFISCGVYAFSVPRWRIRRIPVVLSTTLPSVANNWPSVPAAKIESPPCGMKQLAREFCMLTLQSAAIPIAASGHQMINSVYIIRRIVQDYFAAARFLLRL